MKKSNEQFIMTHLLVYQIKSAIAELNPKQQHATIFCETRNTMNELMALNATKALEPR